MNNGRRKAIDESLAKIAEARADLESVRDEEQETFDNMPENMQGGDKGEKAQAAIDALQEAIDACETAEAACETAKE